MSKPSPRFDQNSTENYQMFLNNEKVLRTLIGLKQTNLNIEKQKKDLEELNELFARFVPPQIRRKLKGNKIEEKSLGEVENKRLSVLRSEIQNYSKMSQDIFPQELFNTLNGFLLRMDAPIREYRGFVSQFVGNEIVALFEGGKSAFGAAESVGAAIAMQQAIEAFNQHLIFNSKPPLSMGIGVHTGDVVWGTIAAEGWMDSSILGEAIDVSDVLKGMTEHYNARIIISSSTYEAVKEAPSILCRELDYLKLKGRQDPLRLYEVFNSDHPNLRDQKKRTHCTYTEGLQYYYEKKWDSAIQVFTQCLDSFPNDFVTRMYLSRCFKFKEIPPPKEWNGISNWMQK